MKNELAYQKLRHFNPAAIRDIRAVLDLGGDPDDLCKNYRGPDREIVLAAVRHMVANPELGVVRWTHGQEYVFVSEERTK